MIRHHLFIEVVGEPHFSGKVVALDEATSVASLSKLGKRFVTRPNASWWWEHLRDDMPVFSYTAPGNDAYRLLPTVCPDQPVILFVSDDEAPPWAGFRAAPQVLAEALGECPGFEYLVADPDGEWLLMENHHGVLIAAGEPVTTNLRRHDA